MRPATTTALSPQIYGCPLRIRPGPRRVHRTPTGACASLTGLSRYRKKIGHGAALSDMGCEPNTLGLRFCPFLRMCAGVLRSDPELGTILTQSHPHRDVGVWELPERNGGQ